MIDIGEEEVKRIIEQGKMQVSDGRALKDYPYTSAGVQYGPEDPVWHPIRPEHKMWYWVWVAIKSQFTIRRGNHV